MILVTKRASEKYYSSLKKKLSCDKCECEFSYDNSDIEKDFRETNDKGFLRCPICKNIIFIK